MSGYHIHLPTLQAEVLASEGRTLYFVGGSLRRRLFLLFFFVPGIWIILDLNCLLLFIYSSHLLYVILRVIRLILERLQQCHAVQGLHY